MKKNILNVIKDKIIYCMCGNIITLEHLEDEGICQYFI